MNIAEQSKKAHEEKVKKDKIEKAQREKVYGAGKALERTLKSLGVIFTSTKGLVCGEGIDSYYTYNISIELINFGKAYNFI